MEQKRIEVTCEGRRRKRKTEGSLERRIHLVSGSELRPGRIRILTYNIFLRPPPIKTNADDFKRERFEDFKKMLREYEVVCLQEMFQMGCYRVEQLIVEGVKQGFSYWCMSESPTFGFGPIVDSGLVILSRYPFEKTYFQSYGIGVLSDCLSDKGFIYCRLIIGDTKLHLFNTHLQASYSVKVGCLPQMNSRKVRLHQCNILATRMKSLLQNTPSSQLILLVGDLNINALAEQQSEKSLQSHRSMNNVHIPHQYSQFLRILRENQFNPIDLFLEHSHSHPITFGDGQSILTSPQESNSKQRLDYIFEIRKICNSGGNDSGGNNSGRNNSGGNNLGSISGGNPKLKLLPASCLLQPFRVQHKQYSQLSDHYGLSVTYC